MNQRIQELQQQLDAVIQSLPDAQQKRYLAEEAIADTLIAEKQFIISELIARASDRDILFFDVYKDLGIPGKLSYGIISVCDLLEDEPAMRNYIGGYRDNLEKFSREVRECGGVVLFIRFSYSDEFLEFCGAGIESLPISKMRPLAKVNY